MAPVTLALNGGSSSLKFALFEGERDVLRGLVEDVGDSPAVSIGASRLGQPDPPHFTGGSYDSVLDTLLAWLNTHLAGNCIAAVGHRIVHGGPRADPVRIDPGVLAELDALIPLAPLHQPHNLAIIRAIARTRPNLPQVACFDTAFHRTMPPVATRFALPRHLGDKDLGDEDRGDKDRGDPVLRRYGFHGLSYEFIAGKLREVAPALARGRVIVAHLGSGASLCALRDGRSIETTMGFSTLDGLIMGTRPGCLDAGAILYLMRSRGMTADALENLLYHRSGLLGLSGISADMRELAASPAPEAAEAIASFTYRLVGEIARLAAALGGLDGLVFTAGIGEHDAPLRADVCHRLAWLGIAIDRAANDIGQGHISTAASPIAIWVVPTDEEAMIARHTQAVIGRVGRV